MLCVVFAPVVASPARSAARWVSLSVDSSAAMAGRATAKTSTPRLATVARR